jgi:HemK-related putative methylase
MVKLNYKSFVLDIPKQVYYPSDDTLFFLDILKKEITSKAKIYDSALELGFGNAYLSLEILNNVKELVCVDINSFAIDYLKKLKQKYNLEKIKVKESNLFNNLDPSKKYDLIIFNPPYVPCKENIKDLDILDRASCGGNKGSQVIINFINNLNKYLNKKGVCYLLFSSLNNEEEIYDLLKKNKLKYKILNKKHLFFEDLIIIKIINNTKQN